MEIIIYDDITYEVIQAMIEIGRHILSTWNDTPFDPDVSQEFLDEVYQDWVDDLERKLHAVHVWERARQYAS